MFNGQLLYERNMIVRVDKGGEHQDRPKLPSKLIDVLSFQQGMWF